MKAAAAVVVFVLKLSSVTEFGVYDT